MDEGRDVGHLNRRVPPSILEWYVAYMSGAHTVTVGDRGRVVVPADLRADLGWTSGTRLHLLRGESGVVVLTDDELLDYVRRDFAGLDLVSELLAERRDAALRGQ